MTTKQNGKRPTERQINALRNFKVAEETIQGLTFDEASQLLDKYIGAIRARQKKPDTNPDDMPEPKSEPPKVADLGIIAETVRERLRQAKQVMKTEFDLPEEMVNPDSVLLGEIMKQIGSEAMIIEVANQKRQNIQLAKQVF